MEEMKRVFISYSWDNDEHKKWVLDLANKLADNGVYVILDRYDLKAGKTMTQFMEKAVNNSEKVLMIMTPNYKVKADNRTGGVGYEYSMITQELYANQDNDKFIPVLRNGSYGVSAPKFVSSYLSHDMTNDSTFEKDFTDLLRIIFEEPEIQRPPLGKKPTFTSRNKSLISVDLIDDSNNLKSCQMTTYAKWEIDIELNTLTDLSKANLFNLLTSNAPVDKDSKHLLPYILSANNKVSHHPDIIFEIPLQRYLVYNHLINEKLKINDNNIQYEFSEYSNNDFWLLSLNQPFSTLFYFLVILKSIYGEKDKEIDVTVQITFNSDKKACLYGQRTPFNVGFIFENYEIPDNKANETITLKSISKDSLYEMFGKIYNFFVSDNPKSQQPYATIDRQHFNIVPKYCLNWQ